VQFRASHYIKPVKNLSTVCIFCYCATFGYTNGSVVALS
jgi:hypothetical protein